MNDLPETVTMSTSGSTDGDASKLRAGGHHDPMVLPHARDDPLWDELRSTFELSLAEVVALKNHACPVVAPVVARPRGVLPRIESGTVYDVSDERIRVEFSISNTKDGHRYEMDAELLVDSGANTELRLPARKDRQLGLEVRGCRLCRGRTNDVCWMLIFSPVLIKATFIRDGVQQTIQADLLVKCDKNEYDALEDIRPGTGGNEGGDPFATPAAHQPTMASPDAGPTPDNNDQGQPYHGGTCRSDQALSTQCSSPTSCHWN